MITDRQKQSIKIALNFCRDRVQVPKKGALDYDDLAKQIASLPDAGHIRELTSFVLEYNEYDLPSSTQ